MSYLTYDQSAQDSQPEELYDFEFLGDNSHYRVTSAAYPVTFESNVYTPIPIQRTGINITNELSKNNLTITFARNVAYFKAMIAGAATYRTQVVLYSLQPDGSYQQKWAGTLKNTSLKDSLIEVVCVPVSVSSKRPTLHRKFQVTCPHTLYDYNCGVMATSFDAAGTIDSISGLVVTSTTFGLQVNGYYTGGYIKVGNEMKTIVKHVGNDITTLDSFVSASASDSFEVFAGCDHTIATCAAKFSNELNFGGFPWIPSDDDLTKGKPFIF